MVILDSQTGLRAKQAIQDAVAHLRRDQRAEDAAAHLTEPSPLEVFDPLEDLRPALDAIVRLRHAGITVNDLQLYSDPPSLSLSAHGSSLARVVAVLGECSRRGGTVAWVFEGFAATLWSPEVKAEPAGDDEPPAVKTKPDLYTDDDLPF